MEVAIDTNDPEAVEHEVHEIYRELFPKGDAHIVTRAFQWVIECFSGRFPGYQAIDTKYHDLQHTMQGTLCLMRLLHGWHRSQVAPKMSQDMFELAMMAILLHDTGYLKGENDREGTGAKYTLVHVSRSVDFASKFLLQKGFTVEEISAVQHMIRCTGVNVDLASIPFASTLERQLGYALGTADLLGQMAADDYIDKLPVLYAEFAEAADYHIENSVVIFSSADDLIRKTPLFWSTYVIPKITNDFQGLYRFLSDPYPDGPNLYLQQASANIERLKQELAVQA